MSQDSQSYAPSGSGARSQIMMPELCQTHQRLLIEQLGYSENDPWRALIIVTQVALFQAMTVDQKVHDKVNGKIEEIARLGCFACYKPDRFGEIVEEGKHGLASIKALGEKWVAESTSTRDSAGDQQSGT